MPSAAATLERIDHFLALHAPLTPFVIIDLETVQEHLTALRGLLPTVLIYYAVKANPAAPVIQALAKLDTGFDLASTGEIDRCFALGIGPERFCFGNTIKCERDIAWAHWLGIGFYAFDSSAELDKLARAAPGSRVFCRLSVHGRGAEWPLTRKFGCSPHLAAELLVRAKALGLRPIGVSFMSVRSRQICTNGQLPSAMPRASSTPASAKASLSTCLMSVVACLHNTAHPCRRSPAMCKRSRRRSAGISGARPHS